MIARDLISDVVPPVRTSDTVQKVFDRMAEFRISHLPIVNDVQFLGLVADVDLIETTDYETQIGALSLSLHNAFLYDVQHIYDVIRLFSERKLSVVPVLNSANDYLGLISINTIVEYIAGITSVNEPGGIIVLEISNRSNSLAHISQIVESNNAQVLSSYVQSFPDSTRLEITLKVNLTDLSAVVASFLRYDYTIKATYNDIKNNDGTHDRYDQLMNYLSF